MAAPSMTVTLQVAPRVHRALEAAARKAGMRVATMAQLLFEAGFAARVGQDRGQPVGDRELDEQVRLVMVLAGQGDSKAIAKATGVPEPLVVKILAGFREARGATR